MDPKISVLLVNLNNLEFTKNCFSDLLTQDIPFNLKLVDQNSQEEGTREFLQTIFDEHTKFGKYHGKINYLEIINSGSNRPLNHLWNEFVSSATTPFLCILNNDVRIAPNFLSSALEVFEKEQSVGFVNHPTNNKNYCEWSQDLNYTILDSPYRQGWDFIFRKECYHEIPSDLNFFFGDDYLYSKLYQSGNKGAYVLNSPMIHFERSTTQEKGGIRDCSGDGDFFHSLNLEIKNLDFPEKFSKWKPEYEFIRTRNKHLNVNLKKLFLVGSYCNSESKLKILSANLRILKNFGKILLFSPFHLEKEITDLVDYFYIDRNISKKEDPILFWTIKNLSGQTVKFTRVWYDFSISVFHQTKSMLKIAKDLDYDILYFCLYDVILSKDLIQSIKDGDESFYQFLSRSNGFEKIINCASQIYSIRKENLRSFEESFDVNKFLKSENMESFLEQISRNLNIKINQEIIIEDHIHTFKYLDRDFYNLSPFQDFKIFICNNANDPIPKIMVYDVLNDCEIFISTDQHFEKKTISGVEILEISPDFHKFEIWKDGVVFDVIENLRKFEGGWWEIIK